MTKRIEKNIELLNENLIKLSKSIDRLNKSYVNITSITLFENELSDNELEILESLCSRFARSSDIFVQKVLKSFFILVQEDFNTFLDIAELSEKLNIISKVETLIMIRDLRNQIAHEYEESQLIQVFKEVIEIIPEFISITEKAKQVINNSLSKF